MLPALITGAATIGSSLLGMKSTSDANQAARLNSAESFAREYGAYKTRYQDTVADMREAGLNPILAASGGFNVGSGASSTPAQTFQTQYPDVSTSAKNVAEAFESRSRVSKNAQEIKNLVKQARLTEVMSNETAEKIQKLTAEITKLQIEGEKLAYSTTESGIRSNYVQKLDARFKEAIDYVSKTQELTNPLKQKMFHFLKKWFEEIRTKFKSYGGN